MEANLAARLRLAREKRGLTGRGLDRAAELHQGHVNQIERGEITDLSMATLAKLARALNLAVGWLGFGEGAEPDWSADAQHHAATGTEG